MAQKVVKNVQTKPIGFAPILAHYFKKCAIVDIIDAHVRLDARRKVLTHGQAAMAMITGILFQAMQLYRICQFAKESTVLDVLLPGIDACEYFDDRMADTLDAMFYYGLGNLEAQITRKMIDAFDIENEICHNDTTCALVYGNCDNNQSDQSIKISFGYSKKYRNDLKQLVWSMSVSSDSAFPLFQQAFSGNTADVDTYVKQWHNLIDLLGRQDFLFVGDSKVASKSNMAHIHEHDGFFLSPLPMYASYNRAFNDALNQHRFELLLAYKEKINRGFEVPLTIDHDGRLYPFRMIILFDHGLFIRKNHSLTQRIEKAQAAFDLLASKLNTYRLKTRAAIDKACKGIVKKYQVSEFLQYSIHSDPKLTYKNKKKGRPSATQPVEKVKIVKEHFRLQVHLNEKAVEDARYRAGYYPLVTNKPAEALSIQEAMIAHKNQYKVEHTYRRSKTNLSLEPIYLQTPERIEAYLFLFKIALQIIVLMERTARSNIRSRNKGLDEFMPNKKDYRRPKAEYLLQKFEFVVVGRMPLADGKNYGFVSELNDLQNDILDILEVPAECFSFQYLFDTS
jgi:transposase